VKPAKKRTVSEPDPEQPSALDEEPPLSHAERRRQKRKAQKETTSEKKPASKKRKLEDGSAKSSSMETSSRENPAKRQNSVWVGNLTFKTTQDDVRRFFDGVGEITRINMPTKPGRPNAPTENRGHVL
jgi:RNA recognition motif-containing protein